MTLELAGRDWQADLEVEHMSAASSTSWIFSPIHIRMKYGIRF